MSSIKEISWAIIGCGDVTEIKSGPGLYKSRNSKLSGVYNRTYEKAVDYAKRHNVTKVYKSVDELLTDSEIDIVYIATPPSTHYEYAIQTLKAEKIPYIEKPMVTKLNQAIEIDNLAKSSGIPPYVAFYRRGLEKFLKIKELLDSGIIGEIRTVHVMQLMKVDESEKSKETRPWRVIPEISGGGKFLDVGTHVLDCLIWFLGELESMTGIVANRGGFYDTDDTVVTTLKFKSGIVGTGHWCFVSDRHFSEVQIIGDRGNITYDGLSGKNFFITVDGETKEYYFTVPKHISMPYQQSIIDELSINKKSSASFSDAMNLVEMCEMLYRQI